MPNVPVKITQKRTRYNEPDLKLNPSIYITPLDLTSFLQCPRKSYYSRQNNLASNFIENRAYYHNKESTDITFVCLQEVIKATFALILKSKEGTFPTWNNVRTSIGIALKYRLSKNLPIPEDIGQITALTQSFYESCLVKYLRDSIIYPNVPISIPLGRFPQGNGIIYNDIVHGIGFNKNDEHFIIDFIPLNTYTTNEFLLNYFIQTRIWGIKETCGEWPDKYIIFHCNSSIKTTSTVKLFTYNFNDILEIEQKRRTKLEITMSYLLKGIKYNITHPSKAINQNGIYDANSKCIHCDYKNQCINDEHKGILND